MGPARTRDGNDHEHLPALVKEAQHTTEQEYLEVIAGMFEEAEGAIPDLFPELREFQ